jgi:hypothetical protein
MTNVVRGAALESNLMIRPTLKWALGLLATAVVLPLLSLLLAGYLRSREHVPQGAAGEGGVVFDAVALSTLLWIAALVLYLVSWFRDSGPLTVRRAIEVSLFCLCLFELWWFCTYILLLWEVLSRWQGTPS